MPHDQSMSYGSSQSVASLLRNQHSSIENLEAADVTIQGRLDLLEQLIVELQVAGHGSMAMTDGPQAGSDLGAGWQVLDQMNAITVTERGVSFVVDTGEFSVTVEGVWQFLFQVNFSHNSDNGGRATNLRLFNVTETQAGSPVPIGIARNVQDTASMASINVDVPIADIGDVFRFEIGGGDTVTTVNYSVISVQAFYHGRLADLV